MPVKKTTFEDLIAWQKARLLCREIYTLSKAPPLSNDWGLRDQVRRAAVSVMSNIAEGWDRATPADTAHFLSMAKASCAELRCQLYILLDTGCIDQQRFELLRGKTIEISRILMGLRKSLRSN